MSRYPQLPELVFQHKCKKILEIGTWSGDTASQMIISASRIDGRNHNVYYYGFDLFEDFVVNEAVGDVKIPPSYKEVENTLNRLGSNITLIKGNSLETVPKFVSENEDLKMDFIFIDGGHAWEVIEQDWNNVQPLIGKNTIVVFDDHWTPAQQWGCNKIVNEIDNTKWNVDVLKAHSPGKCDDGSNGQIRVVRVKQKSFFEV